MLLNVFREICQYMYILSLMPFLHHKNVLIFIFLSVLSFSVQSSTSSLHRLRSQLNSPSSATIPIQYQPSYSHSQSTNESQPLLSYFHTSAIINDTNNENEDLKLFNHELMILLKRIQTEIGEQVYTNEFGCLGSLLLVK